MKRYSLYIFRILLGCILFSGCTDEIERKQDVDVVEGIPTKVSLLFSTPNPKKIETRALTEEDETKVNTLRILVFDKDKQLEINQLFSTSGNAGTVSFDIHSGIKYIYAIANEPGEGSYLEFTEQIDLSDANLTIDQIKSLSVQLKSKTISRVSANLVMTGAYVSSESDVDEGYCNIKDDGSVSVGKIELKLLDTRINFTIQPGSSDVDFVPLTYRVYNIPLKSNLFALENDINDNNFYSQSEGRNFDQLVDKNTGKCSFYVLENRKYSEMIPDTYSNREKEVKNQFGKNEWFDINQNIGKYKYAPDFSTFIEFTGYYTGEENGQKVMANVRYVVHLGEANKSTKSTWNNFATERNSVYNYTVKIYGVDDIRVEVVSSHNGEFEEPNPGAEGEIVETSGYYPMDCHNGMLLLTFNRETVEKGTAGFTIKTPFEEGYYYVGKEPIADASPKSEAHDYKWVMFSRNKKSKGKYITKSYRPYTDTDGNSYADGKLMTIVELLEELKGFTDDSPYDDDGQAVYTAYVLDNYYYSNPITNGKVHWSEFVNKPNRELHILCNTLLSNDEQSSLTTSAIMISQRSIRSFYADGAITAWGVETDNETGEIEWENYSSLWSEGNTADDGRSNFYNQLKKGTFINTEGGWSKIMSYTVSNSQNQTSVEGKKLMQYACLQRNIDENRDGKITLDEIKWYPAAINQLTDMWIGKDALPIETQLYRSENKAVKRYLSSTKDAVLYAEEGSSISGYTHAMSYQDGKLTATNKIDYRCVRNLGVDKNDENGLEKKPMDYASFDGESFSLQGISTACLRDVSDNGSPLGRHDENSDINRPYSSGFKIMDTESKWSNTNNRKPWKEIPGNSNVEGNPCPQGWRTPNQRELALIVRELRKGNSGGISGWSSWLGNFKDYVFSCTSSSLPGKTGYGYALYGYDNSSIITIPSLDSYVGYIRCVKDN